ncbi:MAG: F0F1 ATP synthase subunit B' [Cyanobacteria bacterium P01_H01_bin.15]
MMHLLLFAAETVENVPEGGLFDFNLTLPLMMVQFSLLVLVLNSLFYKPVGKVLDERTDYVRGNLAQAKEKRSKAAAMAEQYEQELKDVRRQAQDVIAAAQAEAQKLVASQVQKVQQEVLSQRQKAADEIAQQKQAAFDSLQKEVDSLSGQILDKLLANVR